MIWNRMMLSYFSSAKLVRYFLSICPIQSRYPGNSAAISSSCHIPILKIKHTDKIVVFPSLASGIVEHLIYQIKDPVSLLFELVILRFIKYE